MTIITNEGKKLITHSIINKLDLFISKVVYADCNLDTLDENTTTLTNIKYENLPTSVRTSEFDNSKIILESILKNDTAGDFFINCVGFIAKNGELLCFTKINRTFVQSAVNNTNSSLFHYKLAIELKNAKDLNIKIDETIVYPTLAHFNASQKAQDELIAKLGLDKVNINDFTASQKAQDEKIKTLETDKADKLNVFTRDEINVKLNAKADKTTTYTKTEVDTSQNAQNTKISALETNKADKKSVVDLTSSQTIDGVKTFLGIPLCNHKASVNPHLVNWQTLQEQLTNKINSAIFIQNVPYGKLFRINGINVLVLRNLKVVPTVTSNTYKSSGEGSVILTYTITLPISGVFLVGMNYKGTFVSGQKIEDSATISGWKETLTYLNKGTGFQVPEKERTYNIIAIGY